jgi:hypothetical protein
VSDARLDGRNDKKEDEAIERNRINKKKYLNGVKITEKVDGQK